MNRFDRRMGSSAEDDSTAKPRTHRAPGLLADSAERRTLLGCLLIVCGLFLAVLHWFGHAGGFWAAADATWRDYANGYGPALALMAIGWWTLPTT